MVMTDNLSIKSYSAVLPLGIGVGQLTLKTAPVDAYNAASLTTSRTVQETVTLPYLAIQAGNGSPSRDHFVYGLRVRPGGYCFNGRPAAQMTCRRQHRQILPPVVGFRANGDGGFAVEFKDPDEANKGPVELTATAADGRMATWIRRSLAWTSMGGPGSDNTDDLKFLGSVDTSAATTKLVDVPDPGRDWIYELEVSAEDYEEIVGDALRATSLL